MKTIIEEAEELLKQMPTWMKALIVIEILEEPLRSNDMEGREE